MRFKRGQVTIFGMLIVFVMFVIFVALLPIMQDLVSTISAMPNVSPLVVMISGLYPLFMLITIFLTMLVFAGGR